MDASVRFINLAYALPINVDIMTRNYLIFRLENIGIDKKGDAKGIRMWFVFIAITSLGTLGYLALRERLKN